MLTLSTSCEKVMVVSKCVTREVECKGVSEFEFTIPGRLVSPCHQPVNFFFGSHKILSSEPI